MPLQRAVERDALADQAFAVIDQQSQIELGPVEPGRRECVDAFSERGARDRHRVDAVGLASLPRAAALAGHQRRRDANDSLAAPDEEALKRAGDMPAVL